jgi:hypothetical protein
MCPARAFRPGRAPSRTAVPSRASSRSSSLPAPSSMIAIPAVACGTNTWSSPSPPAEDAKSAHSPVMSCTTSLLPVDTWTTLLFMPTGLPHRAPRIHPGHGGARRPRRAPGVLWRGRTSRSAAGAGALHGGRGLHDGVRAREHQAGVPVLEADHVGRPAVRAAHLDDLSDPVGRADRVAVDVQPISDRCFHHSPRRAGS